jgi:hypothetical protein
MRRAIRASRRGARDATRREFCALALAGVAFPFATLARATLRSELPREVAGVALPRSAVAVRAAQFARRSCPQFLFNHCMRTFLFGALELQRQKITFNEDDAFVAAALHDLGLLPEFASRSQSFEVDGANAAEKFARQAAFSSADAAVVWHSVALHDTRAAFTKHSGPEALLVSFGAGSDVDGPGLDSADQRKQMEEIVQAFPRLQFKRQFTELLVAQCQRKPLSQRGTWLEGLCRQTAPAAWTDSVPAEIAAAPFAE